jgi:hypothetical protein
VIGSPVLASSRVGLGVALLLIWAVSMFYAFGPLGKIDQAGLFIPGPVWFRRTVVGITGTFALIAGVAFLVGT